MNEYDKENNRDNSDLELTRYEGEPFEITPFEEPENEGFIEKLKAKKGIWGVVAALLLFLFKFKALLFLILTKLKFLLVFLKISKFASTAISMIVMIWVYANIYGLKFAVGFVLLLFVHEMGHYLVARKLNMNVSLPLFIPFVGALISLKEEPKDAVTEAKMAIGGPALGSLAALLCYVIYVITKADLFVALAYTGFFLNIFNLIPLYPLDGGRVVSAISPKIWIVGGVLGAIVTLKFLNPIMIFILIVGIIQMVGQWKNPNLEYYSVNPSIRLTFTVVYFGLLLLLGSGMTYTHGIAQGLIG